MIGATEKGKREQKKTPFGQREIFYIYSRNEWDDKNSRLSNLKIHWKIQLTEIPKRSSPIKPTCMHLTLSLYLYLAPPLVMVLLTHELERSVNCMLRVWRFKSIKILYFIEIWTAKYKKVKIYTQYNTRSHRTRRLLHIPHWLCPHPFNLLLVIKHNNFVFSWA